MAFFLNFWFRVLLKFARLLLVHPQTAIARESNLALTPDLVAFVGDQVTTDLILTPNLEAQFVQAWMNFLQKKGFTLDVFIDGGAHIGMTSRIASAGFKEVIAYEPMHTTFKVLELNSQYYKNITCRNVALYDRNTTVVMGHGDGFVSGASLEPNDNYVKSETVSTTTLDDELKVINFQTLVIKLDVEGGEYKALLGAQKLINDVKPTFIIEILHRYIENNSSDAFEFLKKNGYTFYNVQPRYRGGGIRKCIDRNNELIIKPVDELEKAHNLYNCLICIAA